MRSLAIAAVVLFVAPAAAEFGAGPIAMQEFAGPDGLDAPEPTIGIPWNTDDVFYQTGSTTWRITFDGANVTWQDVTPPYQVPINLDPMLVADEDTGRIFAGGLLGACSYMVYSDDNGETWLPTINMCSGAQFDHQSIGIGPKPVIGNPGGMPQLQNAYYCGQLTLIGCSVSLDGGVTWLPPTPAAVAFLQNGCGGFHGHWRVSRVTGTAFLPVGQCGDQRGMIVPNIIDLSGTEPAGLVTVTWGARLVEGSHPWVAGFDPSIGISRDNGWLYYGDADHKGAYIALSKDEGRSWEPRPGAAGNGTTWVDVGAFHDPPVVAATFADVQAGDDERAAFTFLGIEAYDGIDLEYVQSDLIFSCGERQDELVWHYYAAFTYDGGHNWTVERITDHPVQVGGIYDSLGDHEPGCRNLLDFNDMDIDSMGRVHIAWADGCVDECWGIEPGEPGRFSQEARLFRQVGGKGLFAAHDGDEPQAPIDSDQDGIPDDEDETPFGDTEAEEDSPGIGAWLLLAALVFAGLLWRR